MIDMELDTIVCGDCLDVMAEMPDGCVDLILTDPPYGTTACKWDSIIPLELMWKQVGRIVKPSAAIVMMASQPFTTMLIASNMKMFKYCWVWKKTRPSGFIHAKNVPLKSHEDIAVFSHGSINHKSCTNNRMEYYPQGLVPFGKFTYRPHRDKKFTELLGHRPSHKKTIFQEFTNYPRSIIEYANPNNEIQHPTQKPVALMEYLIKTYTNEGETVLDFCMGSGTTAVAALKLGRRFYGCDINPDYVEMANKRVEKVRLEMAQMQLL